MSPTLASGRPFWFALEASARRTGFFTLELELESASGTERLSAGYARVRRAAGEHELPVYCTDAGTASDMLRALHGVPVSTLRLDFSQPDARDRLALYRERGFRIVPSIDATVHEDPVGHITEIAGEACNDFAHWEVYTGGSVRLLARISSALRSVGCTQPLVARTMNVEEFDAMMMDGLGDVARAVSVSPNGKSGWTVSAIHRIAERAGFEDWTLYITLDESDGDAGAGHLTKRVFGRVGARVCQGRLSGHRDF